jgi:hypothetical protein
MKRLAHSPALTTISLIALFIALGGSVYAASGIDGKTVKPKSLPGNRVKPHSLPGNRIKNNTITGKQVKEAGLGEVPWASNAESAQSAASATNANRAGSADVATKATSATNANHAGSADVAAQATTADSANHAGSADVAAQATSADSAQNAAELEGHQAGCPAGSTQPFAGACWETAARTAVGQPDAAQVCTEAGGQLPDALDLRSFALTSGTSIDASGEWSSTVGAFVAPNTYFGVMVESDGSLEHAPSGTALKYRCVLPLLR